MKIKRSDIPLFCQYNDKLEVPLIILDNDLSIIDMNGFAQRLFDWRNDYINVGKLFNKVCGSDDIPAFFSDKKTLLIEKPIKIKNTIINWNLMPIELDKEKGFFLVGKDVTHEETMYHELENTYQEIIGQLPLQRRPVMYYVGGIRSYLENIIAQMPCYVYWKDLNFRYLGCNKLTFTIMGVDSLADVIGKTDYDFNWDRGLVDAYRVIDAEIIKSGKPRLNFEETLINDKGEVFHLLVNKMPLFDEEHNVIGLVGITVDITAQKKLEVELIDTKAREQHFRVMSSLGGMIAHELRTPLSGIGLGIKTIKKQLPRLMQPYQVWLEKNNKSQLSRMYRVDIEEICDEIAQSLAYADNIIDTVLVGFRPEQVGHDKLVAIKVDDIIQKCISHPIFGSEEMDLVNVKLNPDFTFIGDNQVILHVLINLLKNALYFIKEVGKGEITIWSTEEDNNVTIHVHDTAKGIPKENLEHIFDTYFTTKDTATSIGMGLYFCKVALERTEGKIMCASEEGVYTEFTLILPKVDKSIDK